MFKQSPYILALSLLTFHSQLLGDERSRRYDQLVTQWNAEHKLWERAIEKRNQLEGELRRAKEAQEERANLENAEKKVSYDTNAITKAQSLKNRAQSDRQLLPSDAEYAIRRAEAKIAQLERQKKDAQEEAAKWRKMLVGKKTANRGQLESEIERAKAEIKAHSDKMDAIVQQEEALYR